MPVQIGATAHSFSNPTGLLSDCHRRVEMFLGILEAVAKQIDQPATDDINRALQSALRYFAQAAPKHTADEEESLFPKLRRLNDPEVRTAFAEIDRLEADHRWASPLHSEIETLGTKYLSAGQLSLSEGEIFHSSVSKLSAMYREHIRVEDQIIFPLATKLLGRDEKAAIAEEMTRRRAD